MGAIDPRVSTSASKSRGQKFKSNSLEATLKPNDCSTNLFSNNDIPSLKTISQVSSESIDDIDDCNGTIKNKDPGSKLKHTNSFHLKARKFFNLSPAPLRPSSSTSCLFTSLNSDESNDSSSSLASMPTRASLTHEWKKLKTPNKCRECSLLVYFNGRECSFCGLVAHKKCATNLVIKCSGQKVTTNERTSRNDKKSQSSNQHKQGQQQHNHHHPFGWKNAGRSIQPIYGQPILVDSHEIIDLIQRFVYEIESRGLTSKGIYRVSSIKSKVDRLCNYYDQNICSLIDLSSFHPNIIANAFKMYLRQLPEPLLTNNLYYRFIEIAKKYSKLEKTTSKSTSQGKIDEASKTFNLASSSSSHSSSTTPFDQGEKDLDSMMVAEMREILETLPPINKELISIIMRHLKKVADMSDSNQMSAKNLSIIFGPTLLNSSDKSLVIVDSIHQARVVELMINWAEKIFPTHSTYGPKPVIEVNPSKKMIAQELSRGSRLSGISTESAPNHLFIEIPKVDVSLYEDDTDK